MSLLSSRVRGFRVIEVAGFVVLLGLVVAVYLTKTRAGRERSEIARIEREIGRQHREMKLLRAEVAHLEQPERIERLAGQHLGLAAVTAAQEAEPESLAEIARTGASPPTKPSSLPLPPRVSASGPAAVAPVEAELPTAATDSEAAPPPAGAPAR